MTQVEASATVLIKRFEGLYLSPYLCPAGVPTIGYGATYYVDGTRVTLSDKPISKAHAESLLQWMLDTHYIPETRKPCPSATGNRLAALVDFAFNLGISRLRNSTLRKKVNAGLWQDVPAELRKWVNAGGKPLRGLVARREAEILLIQSKISRSSTATAEVISSNR